jgi:hypothetical protein
LVRKYRRIFCGLKAMEIGNLVLLFGLGLLLESQNLVILLNSKVGETEEEG